MIGGFSCFIGSGTVNGGVFTETSGGSYARAAIRYQAPAALWLQPAAGPVTTSPVFTSGATQLALFDAASGGNLLCWWALTTHQGQAAFSPGDTELKLYAIQPSFITAGGYLVVPNGTALGQSAAGGNVVAGCKLIVREAGLVASPS